MFAVSLVVVFVVVVTLGIKNKAINVAATLVPSKIRINMDQNKQIGEYRQQTWLKPMR